jgi:hypothetical protein
MGSGISTKFLSGRVIPDLGLLRFEWFLICFIEIPDSSVNGITNTFENDDITFYKELKGGLSMSKAA